MMTPSQKKREDLEISKNPRLAKNFNKGFIDHKKKVSKDIVRYRVPSAINKTGNYSNLGKKDTNFTGYSNGLLYTDYKDAFDESNLVNESEYKIKNKSMEEYKNERENGSLELSDIQKIAIEEYNNKMENEEFKRKQNFKNTNKI